MAEVKGLTIAIGADTNQFQKDMKSMDRDINNTSRQVASLTKSLALEWDPKRFQEAQNLAQKAIEQTETKAQALKEELKYLESTGKVDTEDYKKFETQLVLTESKAVQLKKKLEEINALDVDKLSRGFTKAGESITKTGNALKPLSAVAAGLLASFTAIAKTTLDSAGSLDDMRQEIDLNSEALQRWRYIAAQSGLDNQQLQNAFIRTQISVADLAKGIDGPGSRALQSLGISMDDAAKGMDANIDTIIQNLSAIEDPLLKASTANEIFGNKLGAKLIPLLNNGSEGLKALTEEFEAFGYMTNEQVSSLALIGDAFERIKNTFIAFKNEIGVALMPLMQSFADILESKIIPAIRKLVDWFTGLSDSSKSVIMGLLVVTAALAPMLILFGKLATGIGALTSSVGGLSKALTFLAAHPVIAIIAVIVGLIMMLYTTNEQFRESINALIGQLTSALMPLLKTLGNAFGSILKAIMPIINILGNVLAKVIQFITPLIVGWVELFSKYLIPVIELVGKIFTFVFDAIQTGLVSFIGFVEKAINGVINFLNKVIGEINKVAGLIDKEIGTIGNVSFAADITRKIQDSSNPTKPANTISAESVIGSIPVGGYPQSVVTNDYSNKDIKIEVVVQNYAQEVDIDKLVNDINIKLAEQF